MNTDSSLPPLYCHLRWSRMRETNGQPYYHVPMLVYRDDYEFADYHEADKPELTGNVMQYCPSDDHMVVDFLGNNAGIAYCYRDQGEKHQLHFLHGEPPGNKIILEQDKPLYFSDDAAWLKYQAKIQALVEFMEQHVNDDAPQEWKDAYQSIKARMENTNPSNNDGIDNQDITLHNSIPCVNDSPHINQRPVSSPTDSSFATAQQMNDQESTATRTDGNKIILTGAFHEGTVVRPSIDSFVTAVSTLSTDNQDDTSMLENEDTELVEANTMEQVTTEGVSTDAEASTDTNTLAAYPNAEINDSPSVEMQDLADVTEAFTTETQDLPDADTAVNETQDATLISSISATAAPFTTSGQRSCNPDEVVTMPIPELGEGATKEEQQAWRDKIRVLPEVIKEAKSKIDAVPRTFKPLKACDRVCGRAVKDLHGRNAIVVSASTTLPNPSRKYDWIQYDTVRGVAYLVPTCMLMDCEGVSSERRTRNQIDRFRPKTGQSSHLFKASTPTTVFHDYGLIVNPFNPPFLCYDCLLASSTFVGVRFNPRPDAPDFKYQVKDDQNHVAHFHDEYILELSGIPQAILDKAENLYDFETKRPSKYVPIPKGSRMKSSHDAIMEAADGPPIEFCQPEGSYLCILASGCNVISELGMKDLAEKAWESGRQLAQDVDIEKNTIAEFRKVLAPVGYNFSCLDPSKFDPLDPDIPRGLGFLCQAKQSNGQRSGHVFGVINGLIIDPIESNAMSISRKALNGICSHSEYEAVNWLYCFQPTRVEGPQLEPKFNLFDSLSKVLIEMAAEVECEDLVRCANTLAGMTESVVCLDASKQFVSNKIGGVLSRFGYRLEKTNKGPHLHFSHLKTSFATPVIGKPLARNPNHVMPWVCFYNNSIYGGVDCGVRSFSKQWLNDLCAPNSFSDMEVSYCICPIPNFKSKKRGKHSEGKGPGGAKKQKTDG